VSWASGKTALVTGGNSGIGRVIALTLARAGARVIIVARDPAKGARVVAEIESTGGHAEFNSVDLASATAVDALRDRLALPALDLLVNNAGIGLRRAAVSPDMSASQRWEALRGPNLDAAYLTSAAFLPALANSPHGAIVNISSTAALHGNWGLYCVAKAGVEGLTRAFAAEAAPLGVRVNGVSPGWIATENDAAQTPSGTVDGTWQAYRPAAHNASNLMRQPAQPSAADPDNRPARQQPSARRPRRSLPAPSHRSQTANTPPQSTRRPPSSAHCATTP
jgi:NAD(P)-dependent dehydrogenase (short-subunit alcohol dehydrogenase family)